MSRLEDIPIQPVENPILCPPYAEPTAHWVYDTKTGIPSEFPTRRPASYWFKTQRTATGQRDRPSGLPDATAANGE